MKVEQLSAEQRDLLNKSVEIIRDYAKAVAKIIWQIRIAKSGTGSSELVALLSALDVGESIANTTGLSGARALTRDQLLALLAFSDALSALADEAVMVALVDAVGPQNITA